MGKRPIDEAAQWDVFILITAHWTCYDTYLATLSHHLLCMKMRGSHINRLLPNSSSDVYKELQSGMDEACLLFQAPLNIGSCWGSLAGAHQLAEC